MSKYWETGFFEQPSVYELKKKTDATIKRSAKNGSKMEPVIIKGRKIADSWWGNAWCENLERYADYESRLDRGKRYVRTGTVLDLKISKGKVSARVQGSRRIPYKVEVRISPLSEERCQYIIESCGGRISDMEKLVGGDIPQELKDIFTGNNGLFPSPREISFNCSCPDWALMCKHVAAVLYGIGARFDENPLLFFTLRGIDVDRFVKITLENAVEKMLKNKDKRSSRVILDDRVLTLFGIS